MNRGHWLELLLSVYFTTALILLVKWAEGHACTHTCSAPSMSTDCVTDGHADGRRVQYVLNSARAHTHTNTQPFYSYPGEPVPEETFTHPPSWSSSNLYQLLPSTMIHSILPVEIVCLAIFLHNLSTSSLVYLLVWSPPPHIPYISSPNQCLLFITHAHTIATCFAVVSILYHLFLVFLSTPLVITWL